MPATRVNGIEIHYERHGDSGDALVLVHGYTGDIGDWPDQFREFAATHRVLALDHRGHGRSDAPEPLDDYSILQMADDVEALVRDAGFSRYHLVGHSMGGAVAQEIALRNPGSLLSLTLEDTGPVFDFGGNELMARFFEQRLRMAMEKGMAAVADLPSLPPPPHLPAGRVDYEKQRLQRMSPHGFVGAANALKTWEGTRERAHNIDVPTMIIYGELDRGLVTGMQFLAGAIRDAAVQVVDEAAHAPQIERPDIFNAALRRHIERNEAATPK